MIDIYIGKFRKIIIKYLVLLSALAFMLTGAVVYLTLVRFGENQHNFITEYVASHGSDLHDIGIDIVTGDNIKKSICVTKEMCIRNDYEVYIRLGHTYDTTALYANIPYGKPTIYMALLFFALGLALNAIMIATTVIIQRKITVRVLRNVIDIKSILKDINAISIAENINNDLSIPLSGLSWTVEDIWSNVKTLMVASKEKRKVEISQIIDARSLACSVTMAKEEILVIKSVMDRAKTARSIASGVNELTLYQIVSKAAESISGSTRPRFLCHIDPGLRNVMAGEAISDDNLLHIFINHMKNSIDANANVVSFNIVKIEKEFITISLCDNGHGMPKDIVESIYELDTTTKTASEGLRGFGLYISKKLLEDAGGDEYVQSTTRKGTIFRFMIPVRHTIEY